MTIHLGAGEELRTLDALTPREIVAELDRHVVGQAAAKRAVAVALRNRIRRQRLPADLDQMDGYFYGPITVPDGEVFLLGDHRFESSDSRHFGPVPVDDIDGRKLLRFWPL